MNPRNNVYELKLMDIIKSFFRQGSDDKMLDVLADQEVRICML